MKTIFSEDRIYRYTLWREWPWEELPFADNRNGGPGAYVNFIGLNPSTADETKDDPTIRRCIDFARRWGFGGLCMTNLFALRSTYPKNLLTVEDPVGPENNEHLFRAAQEAGMILAAWGKSVPIIGKRANFVSALLSRVAEIKCLRCNADGSPEHPIYVPAVTQPVMYREKIILTHPGQRE